MFSRNSGWFVEQANESALKWAVEEMGMEIIELAGQEKELWIDKVEPIQREYVKKMNERGLNGQGYWTR